MVALVTRQGRGGMYDGDKIKVLICDDSEVVRTGITCALQKQPGYKVIGFAQDGLIAVEKVAELQPDVVLMDVLMPHLDGIEATRQIKAAHPATKVLMLTAADDEQTIMAALASGADSYCLKQGPLSHILQAVIITAAGASWLDPVIAMRVLRNCSREGSVSSTRIAKLGTKDDRFRLSPREIEVLSFLVEGLSNREIAERLCLSTETVKTHMRHIMEKLIVADRTQAAVKALREGLIERKELVAPPPLENLAS